MFKLSGFPDIEIHCSSNIEMVVDKDNTEKTLGADPVCTACEMAVVWMKNQLSNKEVKEKVIEYVDQVIVSA